MNCSHWCGLQHSIVLGSSGRRMQRSIKTVQKDSPIVDGPMPTLGDFQNSPIGFLKAVIGALRSIFEYADNT